MTFEEALEAMKQGKKLYRKAWRGTEMQSIFVSKNSLFSLICDDVFADDWEIYEEPQKKPEMTAEKAVAIMENMKGLAKCCGVTKFGDYPKDEVIKTYDFAIGAIKDNELLKEVNDVLSKSLEKKNKCLCECADKTEAFKHGTYFRALE